MLEIKNVTKSFDRPLFKEMSMTFQETGMYVIVGKSGSGKSTLLNILGGLDNEYQGVIEIDGQDIRQIPHYIRKYIGFIFQQFYLIEEMKKGKDIALITDAGTLVRTRVSEISIVGRNTQGVILIRTAEDENVVGLQRVAEPVDEEDLDTIDGSAAEGDDEIAPEVDVDDEPEEE